MSRLDVRQLAEFDIEALIKIGDHIDIAFFALRDEIEALFEVFGEVVFREIKTADEVPDPQVLSMWLDVNGASRQRGNTATMVFSVARIISYVSECMTLLPGDVIATGTPAGVGWSRKPPLFMKPGDVCEVEIEKIGTLVNPIAAQG
mgnify:CR=1 FL=1